MELGVPEGERLKPPDKGERGETESAITARSPDDGGRQATDRATDLTALLARSSAACPSAFKHYFLSRRRARARPLTVIPLGSSSAAAAAETWT